MMSFHGVTLVLLLSVESASCLGAPVAELAPRRLAAIWPLEEVNPASFRSERAERH